MSLASLLPQVRASAMLLGVDCMKLKDTRFERHQMALRLLKLLENRSSGLKVKSESTERAWLSDKSVSSLKKLK